MGSQQHDSSIHCNLGYFFPGTFSSARHISAALLTEARKPMLLVTRMQWARNKALLLRNNKRLTAGQISGPVHQPYSFSCPPQRSYFILQKTSIRSDLTPYTLKVECRSCRRNRSLPTCRQNFFFPHPQQANSFEHVKCESIRTTA